MILSVSEMQEIDRRTEAEFLIPSLILMENAGRHLADQVRSLFPLRQTLPVLLFCGGGSNGGDGFVAARHLFQMNINTLVIHLTRPENLKGAAALNYRIINKIGVPDVSYSSFVQANPVKGEGGPFIIVDAILGTGFKGGLHNPAQAAIQTINSMKEKSKPNVMVTSADIPSGLSGDAGPLGSETVTADLTVTFGCQKKGLVLQESIPFVGRLVVVDIGIPKRLLESYQKGGGNK